MVQPINYTLNIPNPNQQINQSLQTLSNIDKFKANRAGAQAQQAAQAQMQADLAALGENPSPRGVASLMVKYPQLSEQFKRTYDVLSEEDQRERLTQSSQVYAALEAGRPDVAQELLLESAQAYRNGGRERDAKTLESLNKMIEISPGTAKTTIGLGLAGMMGPDKFTETYSKLQEERRTQEEQPGVLEKQAADLGLTRAQTLKTLAESDKLGAEARKAVLELEAAKSGKTAALPPEKVFDLEKKLRGEYASGTKNFSDVQEAFRRIEAAEDTAAGDLGLIFSYMKMLDPGSVVREGEFATAQNAAGVPTRVLNLYNNLLTGERLNPKQRGSFKSQAQKLLKAAGKRETEIREGLNKVVENYDLNPENVFVTPPVQTGSTPQTQAPPTEPTPADIDALLQKYGGQ